MLRGLRAVALRSIAASPFVREFGVARAHRETGGRRAGSPCCRAGVLWVVLLSARLFSVLILDIRPPKTGRRGFEQEYEHSGTPGGRCSGAGGSGDRRAEGEAERDRDEHEGRH